MKFGVFYELQLPKPWNENSEHQLFQEALAQIELADKIGIDYAWEVEHHFLEEYSHSSAPEVFLGAAATRTKNIRLGHGVKHVIANYSHPARNAECIATLDLVSSGRVEFGFGEGATRSELGAFDIPARTKRAMSIEGVEQICNMMAMTPYPGFEGKSFSMPCRNLVPKPLQKPHPPLWMACTNRDTIKIAASLGVGALAFAFSEPDEALTWVNEYYSIIKSEQCVPIGHAVNANIAMVSDFTLHDDRVEAIRRGQEGIDFFKYAINALVVNDTVPGRTKLWETFRELRGNKTEELVESALAGNYQTSGIGTPDDLRKHLRGFEEAGVDQIILMQQAGLNKHEHICESLQVFGDKVLPEFKARDQKRQQEKTADLAPYIEAALKRKKWMKPLEDHEIPVVEASVRKAMVPDSILNPEN